MILPDYPVIFQLKIIKITLCEISTTQSIIFVSVVNLEALCGTCQAEHASR